MSDLFTMVLKHQDQNVYYTEPLYGKGPMHSQPMEVVQPSKVLRKY